MKIKFLILILLILTFSLSISSFAAEPQIEIVSAPEYGRVYEKMLFTLSASYKEEASQGLSEAEVYAVMIAPSGEKMKAPLFFAGNTENKTYKWQLRFTPGETGSFHCYFSIKTDDVTKETGSRTFLVTKSDKKGFLRKAKENDHYLTYSSGEPYFGIGHNIAWTNNNSIKLFERYFSLLSENGGNLARVWISSWSFPLEWKKLGHYDALQSNNLDKLIALAEEKGIYLILSIDTYGSLMSENGGWNEQDWHKNPYNSKNGGPCREPEEFFNNKRAIKAYKNKLRYIAARWGYSPNILAFELWNEYNAPVEWVEEMSSFLSENDCHDHFITTSHGYPWSKTFDEEQIWQLDNISMITEHVYASSDENGAVPLLKNITRNIADQFSKPFIVSEYGIDSSKNDRELDPYGTGVSLHNSLWAAALSKSCATAMNWWWDSYIRPKNLYDHYKNIALFLADVNWNAENINYVDIEPAEKENGKNKKMKANRYLRIKPEDKWGKARTENIIVTNSGDLKGACRPNRYLHGESKSAIKTDHVYQVSYPEAGEFIVKVGKVSQDAHLYAYLDGKLVLERQFTAGKGKGPWKKSFYDREHDIYQGIYNEDLKIRVPAGKHEIRFINKGVDWLSIERITLTNYLSGEVYNIRCLGLEVGNKMLIWIQNKEYNWYNALHGKIFSEIKNASFLINKIENGSYEVEWWRTSPAKIFEVKTVHAKKGKLRVEIPSFSEDIACKIKKI